MCGRRRMSIIYNTIKNIATTVDFIKLNLKI